MLPFELGVILVGVCAALGAVAVLATYLRDFIKRPDAQKLTFSLATEEVVIEMAAEMPRPVAVGLAHIARFYAEGSLRLSLGNGTTLLVPYCLPEGGAADLAMRLNDMLASMRSTLHARVTRDTRGLT